MRDNFVVTYNRDTIPENLVAELTRAAYSQALQHGIRGLWITVQLDLWRAVEETVKEWAQKWPPGDSWGAFKVWQNDLLVALTEGAFDIAWRNGIEGSLYEVKEGLYRAFHSVIQGAGQKALRRQITRVSYS